MIQKPPSHDLQAPQQLPVTLAPCTDELLSSWVARHAVFYGVPPLAMLRHCLPETPCLRATDLSLNDNRSSAWRTYSAWMRQLSEDLIAALDSEHLSHAVLDVFDVEHLPGTSPLWSHPKVTVLPHISAPTDPDTAAAIVAANIRAYRRDGIVPATINATRGY